MRERLRPSAETAPHPGGSEPSAGPRQRISAGLVAIVVATAGIGFVVRTFGQATKPAQQRPVAATDGGKIAFAAYTNAQWQIFSIDTQGGEATRLTDLRTNQSHPTWSPDGKKIAFTMQAQGGDTEIGAMNADGSSVETLTGGAGWNYLPAWSPDGFRIAFVSNRDGNDEIYVMNADGTDQTRLTHDADEDLSPKWSPDGSRIVFQSNRETNNDIYVMDPDGSGVTNLTDAFLSGEYGPAWSPDGRRIAFASTRDGNPELYDMAADGSDVVRLTNNAAHDWNPAWSPDGTMLAFESDPDGTVAPFVMEVDGGQPTPLMDWAAEACCPAWQPISPEGEAPDPGEVSPPQVDSEPSAKLHIVSPPGSASSLLFAFESLWVASYEGSGAKLTRIDATTNEVLASVPVEDVPGAETGGGGLAAGFGSVWAVGASHDGAILQRIDPSVNGLVNAIQLRTDSSSVATDVTTDENGVWVTTMPLDRGGSSFLYLVDPTTNQVVSEVPLEFEYERHVIAVDDSIVVAQLHWHGQESGPYTIFTSIDPQTRAVTASTPEDSFWSMWTWKDELWALAGGSYTDVHFVRVDPLSLAAVSDGTEIEAERLGSIRTGAGGVWFVTAAGINHWQQPVRVNRLNPDTGLIDVSQEAPDAGGQDMAIGGGAIWFLQDGDVLRFDLA